MAGQKYYIYSGPTDFEKCRTFEDFEMALDFQVTRTQAEIASSAQRSIGVIQNGLLGCLVQIAREGGCSIDINKMRQELSDAADRIGEREP